MPTNKKKPKKRAKKKVVHFSLKNSWRVNCGIKVATGNGEEFENLFSFLFVGPREAAEAYVAKHDAVLLDLAKDAADEYSRYDGVEIKKLTFEFVDLDADYRDLANQAVDLHVAIKAAQ